MRRFPCGHALALAAAMAMTAPLQVFAADLQVPAVSAQAAVTPTADVALGVEGLLTGQAMSMQGQPIAGETVVLSDGREHLSTTTDEKGQFQFTGLRGGA